MEAEAGFPLVLSWQGILARCLRGVPGFCHAFWVAARSQSDSLGWKQALPLSGHHGNRQVLALRWT